MASITAPGIYIKEKLLPPQVSSSPTAPPQAMAGTHARGPLGWSLVTSWSQFVRLYGGFTVEVSALALAVYDYFVQRGGNLYVHRVINADAIAASTVLQDNAVTNTLTVSAANPGTWGNTLNVSVNVSAVDAAYFDLVVYYGGTGAGNVVETWSFLDMDPTSDRYAPAIINGNSVYIGVTDEGAGTNPIAIANDPLDAVAGTNGTAPVAQDFIDAVTDLDTVPEPLVLGLPGTTAVDIINPVIAYAEGREDIFLVLSTPGGLSPTDAVTYADTLTPSSYWALYYPHVVVADASSTIAGAQRTVAPTGSVMGVYARTDLERGLYTAPAGLQARINGAIQPERTLTQTELGTLNNAHINGIKSVRGSGTLVYGARTGLRTRTTDRYVPARRTLIAIKRQAQDLLQFALFANNDADLRAAVTVRLNEMMSGIQQAGGLVGATPAEAFYVVCDDSNNPDNLVRDGILTVEIGAALQTPAEFVVITLAQTTGGAIGAANTL